MSDIRLATMIEKGRVTHNTHFGKLDLYPVVATYRIKLDDSGKPCDVWSMHVRSESIYAENAEWTVFDQGRWRAMFDTAWCDSMVHIATEQQEDDELEVELMP